MIVQARELRRYAPLLGRPAMMLAAADEIERLAAKLEAAEKETASWKGLAKQFGNEADVLRAKIECMEKQEPVGWLRAVDEAPVVTHLGVANESDTYEQAREKLNNLIGWHTDVATDPAVNGGYRLVPIEPTSEMLDKGADQSYGYACIALDVWAAMLAAAPKPEAKP